MQMRLLFSSLDDILKLTPSNLQRIGIASRNDIREFEQMVKFVKENPSLKVRWMFLELWKLFLDSSRGELKYYSKIEDGAF